jgi:hypothetical protein
MRVRGIVQSAELAEDPGGSDRVEMILWVQGVGRDQPRRLVIPFELLLQDSSLDPENVCGHGFQAEVDEAEPGRWIIREVGFASGRVLRGDSEEES